MLKAAGLGMISTLFLLGDDWIQQEFIQSNQAELELRYVLVLWLFATGLWLSRLPWLSTIVLAMFAVLEFIQLCHISYFGAPLGPADISNMIDNWEDVREAGMVSLNDHWHVIPAICVPYGILIAMHHFMQIPVSVPWRYLGWLLVLLILIAKPYRASYRDMDNFMPGPTRSSLHNSLNAFSYFAVNMAFAQTDALPEIPHTPYQVHQQQSDTRHIWLIVADSLRTDRLSVYGYDRKTTPGLDQLHQKGQLSAMHGIASGVTTAVTLPHLLNLVYQPGHPKLLKEQPYNLFRLSQQQGFKTYWVSSQESKLLSYAGSRFIDVSITREDHPLKFLKRHDHAIVDLLKEQSWADKNFLVINLRTAHLPYEENYDQHPEPIAAWPVHSDMPRDMRFGNAYDNSISYLDDVLSEIIQEFDRLQGKRVLMITGDHGQLLGEEGQWGHNQLVPEVVEVPVMVYAPRLNDEALKSLASDRWISHYEAGVWLAAHMGLIVSNPALVSGEHFNHGSQIFGDKYIQRIRETNTGLVFEKPELASEWLNRHALENR